MSWAQGTTAGDETNSEAYAVLMSGENNDITATLYYDENRNSHTEGFATVGMDELMQSQAWSMNRENITTVTIDSSFANYRPTSTSFWFAYCRSLTTISGLDHLNTEAVTDMSFMFNYCAALTSLDLSFFNTENVTNFAGMLGNCSSLTSIDLSSFYTRQATDMNSMFEQSSSLVTINLSSFNTSQVTNMSYMFNECSALTTIYVGSDWSTESVTNSENMFKACTNLVGGAGTTFNSEYITATYARIDGGTSAPGYLSEQDASSTHYVLITVEGNGEVSAGMADVIRDKGDVHVANGEPLEMFFFPDEGYQLASVKIDTLDVTSQVTPATEYSAASYTIPGVYGDIAITVTFAQTSTDAEAYAALSEDNTVLTFYYDEQMTARGGMSVGPFNITWDDNLQANIINSGWYDYKEKITRVVFDTSFANAVDITSTSYWFYGMTNLTVFEGIENLKTQSVTSMDAMFWGCSNLVSLDLSSFDTQNVTTMSDMFRDCSALTSLDVNSFNTANVTNMLYMFRFCSSLTNLGVTSFNTQNVTNMYGMFEGCSSLTALDVTSFNTQKVVDMGFMFSSCHGLTSLDLSAFNTQNVIYMRCMFYDCSNMNTIYVGSGWSTVSVTESPYMFDHCTALVGGAGTTYSVDHIDHTYAHIDGGTANPGYFTDKNATPLEKVATPTFSWRNDELTMSCSTEGATIMYQMSDEDTNGDGVINDDDYKQYSAPIEVKRDVIIKAIATKEGMTTSDPITLDYPYEAWTRLYETCIIGQEILSRASRSSRVPDQMRNQAQTYVDYALDMYGRRTADKDEVQGTREEIEIILSEIQQMMQVPATYSNYVLTAEEDATMAEIADQYGSYYGNQVAAIVWNSSVPMTESDLQRFTSNPNLLIYAQSESMVPANRDNVVINGVAKNVVLTDTVSGNCNFYAPQEFTAEAIQYTRTFSQQTQIGVSRGWEAIALPFTVQTYTHADRGVIAPFGNSASENHFWLRELTQNGLQNAQTIEANKPYIISMPNSEEYRPETNLAGEVTFSALNATVPVTEATPVQYGTISLVPAFQSRSAQTEIYALNVGEERNGYPEGSVFERDYRTVRPFEAYTLHRDNQNPAPQFIMIGGDMGNGTTGIEELVDKRMNTNDSWYTIDGRKLQGAPTGKGLYIRNGKKVIVR